MSCCCEDDKPDIEFKLEDGKYARSYDPSTLDTIKYDIVGVAWNSWTIEFTVKPKESIE